MMTEDVWSAADNDELISTYPEWQRDSILKAREIQSTDHFVELPSKFDIDSYDMMEQFCHEYPNRGISCQLLLKAKVRFADSEI